MTHVSSRLAQHAFDVANRLQYLAARSTPPVKMVARVINKCALPLARRIAAGRLVNAEIYGRQLLMPADHSLPAITAVFPQYNRPLQLVARAVAHACGGGATPIVIDVGANIGDTVAIIEQACPGVFTFLCVEPDVLLAELCKLNHAQNNRVSVAQCFVGENEGAAVCVQNDCSSNPSTNLVPDTGKPGRAGIGRLTRLDTLAGSLCDANHVIGLIKVDTEGYDFSVLRSGPQILRRYKPALFFECFPKLLSAFGERVEGFFEYLSSLGYHNCVFFTNIGDFYRSVSYPTGDELHKLMDHVLHSPFMPYFDVFASPDQNISNLVLQTAGIATLS